MKRFISILLNFSLCLTLEAQQDVKSNFLVRLNQNLHQSQARNFEYEFSIHSIYSKFSINSNIKVYDEAIRRLSSDFPMLPGIGVSFGITKQLHSKFQLNFSARWQRWGGTLNDPYSSTTDLIDVYYSSISIPLLLQFKLIDKRKIKLLLNAGVGADVSYFVRYRERKYANDEKEPNFTESIITPNLTFGSSLEIKPKSNHKLKYVLGINVTDDRWLSPKRYYDYTGLSMAFVAINTTLVSTFVGIKF